MSAGKRNDLDRFRDDVIDGATMAELLMAHPGVIAKYRHYFKTVTEAFMPTRKPGLRPLIVVRHGCSGAGKTKASIDACAENAFYVRSSATGPWFDGYGGERYVIFEELDKVQPNGAPHYISPELLLILFDSTPCRVNVKGDTVPWNVEYIFITSNLHPLDWFPAAHPDTRAGLGRRVMQFPNMVIDMGNVAWVDPINAGLPVMDWHKIMADHLSGSCQRDKVAQNLADCAARLEAHNARLATEAAAAAVVADSQLALDSQLATESRQQLAARSRPGRVAYAPRAPVVHHARAAARMPEDGEEAMEDNSGLVSGPARRATRRQPRVGGRFASSRIDEYESDDVMDYAVGEPLIIASQGVAVLRSPVAVHGPVGVVVPVLVAPPLTVELPSGVVVGGADVVLSSHPSLPPEVASAVPVAPPHFLDAFRNAREASERRRARRVLVPLYTAQEMAVVDVAHVEVAPPMGGSEVVDVGRVSSSGFLGTRSYARWSVSAAVPREVVASIGVASPILLDGGIPVLVGSPPIGDMIGSDEGGSSRLVRVRIPGGTPVRSSVRPSRPTGIDDGSD